MGKKRENPEDAPPPVLRSAGTAWHKEEVYRLEGAPWGLRFFYLNVPQLNAIIAVVDEVRHGSDSQRKRHHAEQYPPRACTDEFLPLVRQV